MFLLVSNRHVFLCTSVEVLVNKTDIHTTQNKKNKKNICNKKIMNKKTFKLRNKILRKIKNITYSENTKLFV